MLRNLNLHRHLHSTRLHFPFLRLISSTPTPTPPNPSTTPLLPLTPPLRSALSELQTLPEFPPPFRNPLPNLHRLLEISTSHLSPLHSSLIHSLLSTHHHSAAQLTLERHHRLQQIEALTHDDNPVHKSHLCAAHTALSLSCLRAPSSEARLAALAAAETAAVLADSTPLRMAASLVAAMAKQPSLSGNAVLSALVALDHGGDPVDLGGFARALLAVRRIGTDPAVDHAKALVVRWEHRGGYDFIEALCLAARCVLNSDVEMAEDFLERAVSIAAQIGNDLDKSEALLGLASVYEQRGRVIEAEGLYRAIEERFERVREGGGFSVESAEVYCRAMESFATFLERVEFNGRKREREAQVRRGNARDVRDLFPEVLVGEEEDRVPLWIIASLLPHFEMPVSLGQRNGD